MLFVREFNQGRFNQGGVLVTQSYLTLCNPTDCSPLGSSEYGILQARILAAAKSLQSCPTLCDPIDGSPSGSSSLEFSRPRILEWVPISSSRGSSPTQGWIPGLLLCRQILLYLREQVSPQQSRVRWRYEP